MENKRFNTRIQQKIDIKANWDKATNFIPLEGELIIYSDIEKFKIGDGVTSVVNLPYFNDEFITVADIDQICGATINK